MTKSKTGLLSLIAVALALSPSTPNHRVATGSKFARRMNSRKTPQLSTKVSAEIQAWNAAVDAKKAAKKQAKLARKAIA